MNRILIAAALLLSPLGAGAQVDYKFTNFVADYSEPGRGTISATLLFRNTATYSQPATMIDPYFRVEIANGQSTYCGVILGHCNFDATATYFVGAVQQSVIVIGNNVWNGFDQYYAVGCQVYCFGHTLASNYGTGIGVFGCNVPPTHSPFPRDYVARTCDADGFTGWLATDVLFQYQTTGNKPLVEIDDFTASFNTTEFPDIATVPEPSSYAMLAVGLIALGAAARRKRTRHN